MARNSRVINNSIGIRELKQTDSIVDVIGFSLRRVLDGVLSSFGRALHRLF